MHAHAYILAKSLRRVNLHINDSYALAQGLYNNFYKSIKNHIEAHKFNHNQEIKERVPPVEYPLLCLL